MAVVKAKPKQTGSIMRLSCDKPTTAQALELYAISPTYPSRPSCAQVSSKAGKLPTRGHTSTLRNLHGNNCYRAFAAHRSSSRVT